jgi:hypothetical protein
MLDLGGLDDGAYELTVTVRREDGSTASATRAVSVKAGVVPPSHGSALRREPTSILEPGGWHR